MSADDDLRGIRRSYLCGELTEDSLRSSWIEQLRAWYHEAVDRYAELAAAGFASEPNAMQVATVATSADGSVHPDVRTVLCRGMDQSGVVFFTNYSSAKGAQLAQNPAAAAVFAWLPLERQVRLRGPVSRVSEQETADYFASRPRGAQLAAWASPQSSVLNSREELDARLEATTDRFADTEAVPPPPFWGGYRITVREAEFWQGRQYRLHDRLRFRQSADGSWQIERLAP